MNNFEGLIKGCDLASMRRRWTFFSLIIFSVYCSFGQDKSMNLNSLTIGPLAANNGLGIATSISFGNTTPSFSNQISLSLRTLKHAKEVKIQNPRFTNPKPYVYGKLNNAYILNLGIARYKTLGISSAYNPSFKIGIQMGPSLALLKPYYVYVHEQDDPFYKPITTRQTREVLDAQESILGAANWSQGINELTAKAGLHCDVNLLITWDKLYRLKRLKTGVKFDYFWDELQILNSQNNTLFTSFYTTYQIGANK